jgi:hypothetical protein
MATSLTVNVAIIQGDDVDANQQFAAPGLRIQRNAIDGFLPVRCHVSNSGILIDSEIVGHAPR